MLRRSPEQRTEQELRRQLQANVAAVGACYPSAEALREEAAEAERLAARDGVPPKTAAVVRSLMRRWSAFLEVHDDEYIRLPSRRSQSIPVLSM